MMKYLIALLITAMISCATVWAEEDSTEKESQKEQIPLMVNLGFGAAQYRIHDLYSEDDDLTDPLIKGVELDIKVVIEKETINRFQDRVPEKFRNVTARLGEVSVGYLLIPQSIFVHSKEDNKEAYGATWGFFDVGMRFGWPAFSVGVNGGVIATYMYYRDYNYDDSIHFIRPGLRGSVNVKIPLFTKYLQFEAGARGDIYIPAKGYNEQVFSTLTSHYAMIHFRIPFNVEAEI